VAHLRGIVRIEIRDIAQIIGELPFEIIPIIQDNNAIPAYMQEVRFIVESKRP
jgi:hypothetical protein